MTCSKVGYETKSEAKKDGAMITRANRGRNHSKTGKKLAAYECRHCQKWHLTSAKQRKY